MGGAAAQHSETVYAQFLSVPGLKLVVPSGPSDMKGLLKSAIRDNNPVIVFEHGGLGRLQGGYSRRRAPGAARQGRGQARGRERHGGGDRRDGAEGDERGGEARARKSISVEVVDPRTLIPLDEETILASVEKTNRIMIADEGHLRGGAAADIAAIVADKGFDFLDAPISRVTALDVPIPFSPPLEKAAIASEARIEAAIRDVVGR